MSTARRRKPRARSVVSPPLPSPPLPVPLPVAVVEMDDPPVVELNAEVEVAVAVLVVLCVFSMVLAILPEEAFASGSHYWRDIIERGASTGRHLLTAGASHLGALLSQTWALLLGH